MIRPSSVPSMPTAPTVPHPRPGTKGMYDTSARTERYSASFQGDSETVIHIGSLTSMLSGPMGSLAIQYLRVRPRQRRSVESVDRIISATAGLTFDQRGKENLSIEKIAKNAGVTPQAIYRYFRDTDEILKTTIRFYIIKEIEQIVWVARDNVFADEAEMAIALVGIVLDTCESMYKFPYHLQDAVVNEYRQVSYDASPLISEIICKNAGAGDVRRSLDVINVSVALTATIAIATSSSFEKMSPRRGSRLEIMLDSLFASVLRSEGHLSDKLCEIESQFDAFWNHTAN